MSAARPDHGHDERRRRRADGRLQTVVRIGLLGGAVAIYLCLVGIVPVFADAPLIVGVVSLGQATLLVDLRRRRLPGRPRALAVSRVQASWRRPGRCHHRGLPDRRSSSSARSSTSARSSCNASPELYALLRRHRPDRAHRPDRWSAWSPARSAACSSACAPRSAAPLVWGLGRSFIFGLFGGLLRTPLLMTPLADWPATSSPPTA